MNFPEYVRITQPVKMPIAEYIKPSTALNFVDFKLHWYTTGIRIDGVHNIEKPSYISANFIFPVYECPLCKCGLIVPFPEVENQKELEFWFSRHLFENHIEDRTK